MPDSFFTHSPEWRWWIVFYFFIGGIAGGAFALSALLRLFGQPGDRPISRLGYFIAFPGSIISGLLLILDLKRPERFWHMLIQSETFRPAFKWWSPISVGSWGLLAFGFFSFLAFVGALAEIGWLPRGLSGLIQGSLGAVVNVLGGVSGFFLAGYTGVLLSTTNRPLWSDTVWLGLLFLVSGFSTGAALLLLLSWGRNTPTIRWLKELDTWTLVLELVVLVILLASVGTAVLRPVLFNAWGVLLLVGVVLVGILVPILLHFRPVLGRLTVPSAAVLVLVGGFILRVVMLLSSEAV
ncbi:hypothetical protein HRbin28_01537 [bacterium HR28]|jgi:formate-dependent nitrite reductase membrane component NrfD|uniref:Polysulfide reductase n=1 Tax=Thermomicrobium roseum TaxID=500 RepID=A0A7C1FYF1_THERO|nr:hypothetical protein HRbin28_01537 [bacterium HR28]